MKLQLKMVHFLERQMSLCRIIVGTVINVLEARGEGRRLLIFFEWQGGCEQLLCGAAVSILSSVDTYTPFSFIMNFYHTSSFHHTPIRPSCDDFLKWMII